MAGFQIVIKDEAIRARLKKLEAATGNLLPVLRSGGQVMMTSVRKNFEVGGRPKWQPLSAVTANSPIGKKGSRLRGYTPILHVRGFLKNVTLRVTKDQAILGTAPNTKDYAARQQFGWPGGGKRYGGKVKTPARPFMLLQAEDRQEILAVLDKHIEDAMTK